MYKERNMLSIENGAFNARNKRTVEKHGSLQAFYYEQTLIDDREFLRVNALEIALRNGDIMSPPDPSKPWKKHRAFSCFS